MRPQSDDFDKHIERAVRLLVNNERAAARRALEPMPARRANFREERTFRGDKRAKSSGAITSTAGTAAAARYTVFGFALLAFVIPIAPEVALSLTRSPRRANRRGRRKP
jgi:hypothetical protein